MNVWLQAVFLIASSKKGVSSNQIQRMLGITLKAAWFLSHRIRDAMRSGDLTPFGANGGVVEVDETFIGRANEVVKSNVRTLQHVLLEHVELRLKKALQPPLVATSNNSSASRQHRSNCAGASKPFQKIVDGVNAVPLLSTPQSVSGNPALPQTAFIARGVPVIRENVGTHPRIPRQ